MDNRAGCAALRDIVENARCMTDTQQGKGNGRVKFVDVGVTVVTEPSLLT